MGIARPKSVDSKGVERGGGGGGGGATDPYRDWTTIDIHDASLWQRRDATVNSAAASGTITSSGGVTTYSNSATGKKHIQPGAIKGTFYIAKAHLKPYEECGLAEPTGVGANEIYPEQFSIKVELLLDDIPITGPTGSESDPTNHYGRNGQVLVGLVHYASDQNNAPAMPDQNSGFVMARMYKNKVNDPTSTTDTLLYKSGYVTGAAQASVGGATFKCQFNPTRDVDHNAIVLQATFGATSRSSADRVFINGGSYSTTNPRSRFTGPAMGNNGGTANEFTGADNRFVHIAVGFCAFDSDQARVFSIRVKRVRYVIQPISNREDFTAE
tara:strand:+ start:6881 stop:7861 length:981 start_codon:yes stop_codon:yes gene_type:complete